MLEEIPVAFPLVASQSRLYVVNEEACTVREGDYNSDASPPVLTELLDPGGASSNVVAGGLLVTAPVSPSRFSVTFLPSPDETKKNASSIDPVIIHLDLGLETSLGNIVCIKAFPMAAGSIQLMMVDSAATVLTVRLLRETLVPTTLPSPKSGYTATQVRISRVFDFLKKSMDEMVQNPLIRSNMVAFLCADRMLVALNPFLLCVDLNEEKVAPWSKSQCEEDMMAQARLVPSLVSKGFDLILGKIDSIDMDMEPVAALCTADNDEAAVFSLHSDGTVLRWSMDKSKALLLPMAVQVLKSNHVPSHSTWSDNFNSTYMKACIVNSMFVLAIHVQTIVNIQDTSEGLDESRRSPSKHVIVVIDGLLSLTDEQSTDAVHSIRLAAPRDATSLVGLHFDTSMDRLHLRALFLTASSSVFCTYLPSNLSMVSREPTYNTDMNFIAGVASSELERIETLSFLPYQEVKDELEDATYAVDRRFLRYLFKPVFPRGVGTIMPPDDSNIRNAMRKLNSFAVFDTKRSIELEVVSFVRQTCEGRRHDSIATESKRISNDAAAGHNAGALESAAPSSLYKRLEGFEPNAGENMEICTTAYNAKDLRNPELRETVWRELLLKIWEEESHGRTPLALGATASTLDASIVIRSQCLSIVRNDSTKVQNGELIALDQLATAYLTALRSTSVCTLTESEELVREKLSVLASKPTRVIRDIKDILGELGSSFSGFNCDEQVAFNRLEKLSHNDWRDGLRRFPVSIQLHDNNKATKAFYKRQDMASMLQIRRAAASWAIRKLNAAKDIFLGRFLVLAEMKNEAADLALLMYLHTTNIMAIASHAIPSRTVSLLNPSLSAIQMGENNNSPPKKRTRIEIALQASTKDDTIVLFDSLLVQVSRKLEHGGCGMSFAGESTVLANLAVDALYQFSGSTEGSDMMMPELALLQTQSKDLSQHSLALRLLAPFTVIPFHPETQNIHQKRREEVVAECLLIVSHHKPQNEAKTMIEQAFGLLNLKKLHMSTSIRHLSILQSRIGDNLVGCDLLMKHIDDSIMLMGLSASHSNLETFLTALFNSAVSVKNWDKAYDAGLRQPLSEKRLDLFQRLIRAMVDAGELANLIKKCSALTNTNEEVQDAINFYEVASNALSEFGIRDTHRLLTGDSILPPDYEGAQYALHVSQGQWKKAAISMDVRCRKAQNVLDASAHDPMLELSSNHKSDIVQDLAVAAVGCYFAMTMVLSVADKYIYTDEVEISSNLPLALQFESRMNHDHSGRSSLSQTTSTLPQFERFCSMRTLKFRTVASALLMQVSCHGDAALDFTSLCNRGNSPEHYMELVNRLFFKGFYVSGLLLAINLDQKMKIQQKGRGHVHDAVCNLVCNHLVPLAVDPKYIANRCSISQLQVALDGFVGLRTIPLLINCRQTKSTRSIERSRKRCLAMQLLMELTTRFTCNNQPIAIEVAEAFLKHHWSCSLPHWLEDLLLFGMDKCGVCPGIFSSRNTDFESAFYCGDPSALLSRYIVCGLYTDACRIVSVMLEGQSWDHRQLRAPSRLPENGEVDFIPIQKINLLWNLMSNALEKKLLDSSTTQELEKARCCMKQSLTRYFVTLQVGDVGCMSSRALSN